MKEIAKNVKYVNVAATIFHVDVVDNFLSQLIFVF